MPFTLLFALFTLISTALVFGLTYNFKGLKLAVISSAAVFTTLFLVLVGIISLITTTS